MNKEDIISSGLLEQYALGLTSPEETMQVQEALDQYPELKQELDSIEKSLELFAQTYAIEPSSTLKDKIFSQLSKEEDGITSHIINKNSEPLQTVEPKTYRIPFFFKLAAAAMFVLLIGSIILNYSYYTKYQNSDNELQIAQQKIKENQQANLAMKTELNVMSDKNALPIVLNGTPQAPEALAKIYWMKNTGDVYVDPSNLPAAPEGKQYQLWAIIDGKPVDGGMITTEKGIYHIQKMKSFGRADAFAITLEKSGGSPTPKGEMYVMSKI